jgi:hypothetical protein
VIAKQVVEVLEAKVNAVAIATGQSKKKANDLETRVAEIADKVGS